MDESIRRRRWTRSPLRLVAIVSALGVAACGGAGTEPTPSGDGSARRGSDIIAVDVSCPSSLLIGQKSPCVAVARMRSGQMPVVNPQATWSSMPFEIAAVEAMGLVNGRAAGQATVSASYQGFQGSATLVVTDEDALRVSSGQAHQGDFTPGSTVTMWMQGYYAVSSAAAGQLSLQISDQVRVIVTTPPMVVVKGGDFFLLSSTFVVPQDSVEVCRAAVLQVGPATIIEPASNTPGIHCIAIRR